MSPILHPEPRITVYMIHKLTGCGNDTQVALTACGDRMAVVFRGRFIINILMSLTNCLVGRRIISQFRFKNPTLLQSGHPGLKDLRFFGVPKLPEPIGTASV